MMAENENEILHKVIEGDAKAYAHLVDMHKQMAFTIAWRIVKNREDAEEIAQDAFVKVYQSIATFKGTSKFSTWLFRIVYNAAISSIRKKKIEKTEINNDFIENYTLDEINENLEKLEEEEQKFIVEKLLDNLNPEESTLINLYYFQDLSTEEMAEVIGISKSNVKVKLHRIRNKMHLEANRILSNQLKEIHHEKY